MKPVDQEYLHNKDGAVGDCFRACIASILEVPIAAVPHFALLGSRWHRVAEAYLSALGRQLLWETGDPPKGVWAIVTVQSPRNPDVKHSVIYRDGVLVHDPHPSKAGGEPVGNYFVLDPDRPSPHCKLEEQA